MEFGMCLLVNKTLIWVQSKQTLALASCLFSSSLNGQTGAKKSHARASGRANTRACPLVARLTFYSVGKRKSVSLRENNRVREGALVEPAPSELAVQTNWASKAGRLRPPPPIPAGWPARLEQCRKKVHARSIDASEPSAADWRRTQVGAAPHTLGIN